MSDTAKGKTRKSWFKNISWPDQKTLTKETVAVLVVSVLLGLITAGLDFIIRYGLEFLIK